MSLYDFVYNQASQLWYNEMPLCGQYLTTEPFIVSPIGVAVIFLPVWRQSISRVCFQAHAISYVTWRYHSLPQ
jgi:hypothetical protein